MGKIQSRAHGISIAEWLCHNQMGPRAPGSTTERKGVAAQSVSYSNFEARAVSDTVSPL